MSSGVELSQIDSIELRDHNASLFERIYNAKRGAPYTFNVEDQEHHITCVPMGRGNLQTITYSLNFEHTLILYDPETKVVRASKDNVLLQSSELSQLLQLISDNLPEQLEG